MVALDHEYHPFRTSLAPLPKDGARPLWSVMIPTYNCTRYLPKTLTSVLTQDLGTSLMQIEVVDDHSQDDVTRVVDEIGAGRVSFYRQPTNVGHIHNFDTCLRRAKGQLIHMLHGDDFVYDGFYRKLGDAFVRRPDLGAAFCRQVFVEEDDQPQELAPREAEDSGVLDNWLSRLAVEQRIMTPSIVVPRSIYEQLGGFDHRLGCSEDWEMWVRIAARFPVWYEVEPLAAYRMHSNSNTGRHVRNGEDMYYTNMAIDIFKSYLPPSIAPLISKQAKETYALAALRTAHQLAQKLDMVGVRAQVREALRMSHSWRVIKQTARLLPWFLWFLYQKQWSSLPWGRQEAQ